MTRPQDFGDQFPSDIGDVAPPDPTINLSEFDGQLPLAEATAKFQRLFDFKDDLGIEQEFPDRQTVFYGQVVKEVSQKTAYPRVFEVLRQDGKTILAQHTRMPPTEKFLTGESVVVLQSQIPDQYIIIGKTTPNDLIVLSAFTLFDSDTSSTEVQVPVDEWDTTYGEDEAQVVFGQDSVKINSPGLYAIDFNVTVEAPTTSAEPLYIVELTDPLSTGGMAGATICVWNGSSWVATGGSIIVHDPLNRFSGTTGERFWVILKDESARYEIVSTNDEGSGGSPANEPIIVELTDPLSFGGIAGATICEWNGTSWDDTGGSIIVHDPLNRFTGSTGERFWVIYKNESARYEVVSTNDEGQGEELELCQLISTLSIGGSTNARLLIWDGANWTIGPFTITVHDPLNKFSGSNGDRFWVVYKTTSGQYEIVSANPIGSTNDLMMDWCNLGSGADQTTSSGQLTAVTYTGFTTSAAANIVSGDIATGHMTVGQDGYIQVNFTTQFVPASNYGTFTDIIRVRFHNTPGSTVQDMYFKVAMDELTYGTPVTFTRNFSLPNGSAAPIDLYISITNMTTLSRDVTLLANCTQFSVTWFNKPD